MIETTELACEVKTFREKNGFVKRIWWILQGWKTSDQLGINRDYILRLWEHNIPFINSRVKTIRAKININRYGEYYRFREMFERDSININRFCEQFLWQSFDILWEGELQVDMILSLLKNGFYSVTELDKILFCLMSCLANIHSIVQEKLLW